MLLRINRLLENRVSAAIPLLHGSSRIIEVIKRFRLDGSHMRDNGACIRIHLQDCPTAWTGQIKVALLSHLRKMIPQNRVIAGSIGRGGHEKGRGVPTQALRSR